MPPLGEAEWIRVFDLYKQSPEYQKVNGWMELEDFKRIFFWEWFHRLWGRLIGLVFALPLLWFWLKNKIPQGYGFKLSGMLVLGGLQGLMGWYMVKSGLVDMPAVSHYRLAAHLFLAMLIFALLIWLALSLGGARQSPNKILYKHTWGVLFIAAMTIFWGAFTAGLDAGLLYGESFPKMGGHWLPQEVSQSQSFWLAIIDMPAGVQWVHRWLAMTMVLAVLSLWGHSMIKKEASPIIHAAAIIVIAQFCLGLLTLFSGVHMHIAVTHQAGAMMLLGVLVACLFRLRV